MILGGECDLIVEAGKQSCISGCVRQCDAIVCGLGGNVTRLWIRESRGQTSKCKRPRGRRWGQRRCKRCSRTGAESAGGGRPTRARLTSAGSLLRVAATG
eukprot:3877007-Rhodomonas_salina.1